MSKLCEQLEAFADGELPSAQAQAFSEHLTGCTRCQTGLTGLLQLEQLGKGYVETHGPVKVPWHVVPRNRWIAAGSGLFAAVLLLLVVGGSFRTSSTPVKELWAAEDRTLEARVTYSTADRHRKLAQRMMGSEPAQGAVQRLPSALGRLEERGDLQQLVAAYLAVGKPDTESARTFLKRMESDERWAAADVSCDLGVSHYLDGNLEEALRLFNQVLRRQPNHPQALWNRALVYRKLGLPLLARQDFEAVARLDEDEGWRRDALAQTTRGELAGTAERKARWLAAGHAGDALVARGAEALQEALPYADVPMMRREFYDAVRTRTTPEQVRALLPLAERLDEVSQGSVLADYVRHTASRDFARRAPVASLYTRLYSGQASSSEVEQMLQTFLASGEEDIVLGALVRTRLPRHAEELIRRARTSTDPWFQVLGLQIEASGHSGQGQYDNARKLLEAALTACEQPGLAYRCMDVRNDLSHVLAWLFDVNGAMSHAQAGLQKARETSQWDKEGALLQSLGNAARLSTDVTLGRAYYSEALQVVGTDADPLARRNIHQALAHLAIQALELDEARAELDHAIALELPMTVHGAEALVDVARTRRSPGDASALDEVLALERQDTPGQRAYVKFLRGRFLVEVEPQQGRMLLEDAIREAEAAAAGDINGQHARTYSFTSLIFDDARRGDFPSALNRLGVELGFEVPATCVLGLTEDTERSLVVARAADGRMMHVYEPMRTQRLPVDDLSGVVPQEIQDALAPCVMVDVLARPPLQGRQGLLNPALAWRYRTRRAPPRAPEARALHIVVNEVFYADPKLELLTWVPRPERGAEVRILRGREATPARVLEAMRDATEIDLATHGEVSPGGRASHLELAPDPKKEGMHELHEDSIRSLKLTGAPLVVLAACEAARGTTALHVPSSLPNAFLAAGARGVLAAMQKIPDEDSSAFFGEVRERVRAGATPGIAVRDVRLQWLRSKQDVDWVNSILVFE